MADSPAPAVLTVAEVSKRLRIGRRQTYEALKQGQIPGVRIGKSWRISRVAFEDWLNQTNRTPALGVGRMDVYQ